MKVLSLVILILGILPGFDLTAVSANGIPDKYPVNLNLTGYDGELIEDAVISVRGVVLDVKTEAPGRYSFDVDPEDLVIIAVEGYRSMMISGKDIPEELNVNLEPEDPPASGDDVVMPHKIVKKRYSTGSYKKVEGKDLVEFPALDLRTSLIGLASGISVSENNGAPGLYPAAHRALYGSSEKVDVLARGRNVSFVIDGMPVAVAEAMLDPDEIESVTFVKDIVGKNMFGPLGADGIIMINTKRGHSDQTALKVNMEAGLSVFDRFPEWVSGADYAWLNNQAREGSGISPIYSAADISAYERNDPYDLRHPSVDYSELMLKNNRGFQKVNLSARGGGESVRYYSYLGFNREGDNFAMGSKADYNKLNFRSNVDIDINKFITTNLDINGNFVIRRTPGYGYTTAEGQANMGAYEFNVALPAIIQTPPVAFPVYANNDPELSSPWYAMSSQYGNPVGNLLESGDYNEQTRRAGINLSIHYDLSQILDGLRSRTTFGFEGLNLIRIGQANQYEGYRVNLDGSEASFTRLQARISDDTRRKLHDYYLLRGVFSQNFGYDKRFGNHNLETDLTFFLYRKITDNELEPQSQILSILSALYAYKDKYIVHGVLNNSSTYSFARDQRTKLFPSVGFGWLISEEDFLVRSNVFDFLKLRVEVGKMGFDPYLNPQIVSSNYASTTRSPFGPYPLNRWFGSDVESAPPSTYPTWVGNPSVTWEERKEFSAGVDAELFNRFLLIDLTYYNNVRDGVIGRLTNSLPSVTGMSDALPYLNHNKFRYSGLETGIHLRHETGNFDFTAGGNFTFQSSKILLYDEPNYRYDYLTRTGTPIDAYWGFQYQGKFQSDDEAAKVVQFFDPVLKAGDLRYADLNNDGVIDNDDVTNIGNTSPRFYYSLDLKLGFKNFGLKVIGSGAAFFDIPMTSIYFRNGWGDNNYSRFVRDNIGGDYPRLTYERIANNFQNSAYWLMKGDYFKIKYTELSYTIAGEHLELIGSKGIKLFLRGANLLTLSGVKDIDPEAPLSGINSYPLNKIFTGGFTLNF